MAAAKGFRAKSATYKSTAITGITDDSIKYAGSGTDLNTDASAYVTAVFVDSIAVDVTITTTDVARATSIAPGDTGSLVVVYEQRAEGSGATGGGDKTATMANATVLSVDPQAGSTGIGSVQITFRCSGPTAAPVIWS